MNKQFEFSIPLVHRISLATELYQQKDLRTLFLYSKYMKRHPLKYRNWRFIIELRDDFVPRFYQVIYAFFQFRDFSFSETFRMHSSVEFIDSLSRNSKTATHSSGNSESELIFMVLTSDFPQSLLHLSLASNHSRPRPQISGRFSNFVLYCLFYEFYV